MNRMEQIKSLAEASKEITIARLRNDFAKAALTGILAGWNYSAEGHSVFNPHVVAKRAYAIADAMLLEGGVL